MKHKFLLLKILVTFYDKTLQNYSLKNDPHASVSASLEDASHVEKSYNDTYFPLKDKLAIFKTSTIPNHQLPAHIYKAINDYFTDINYDNYIYYDDLEDSKELWAIIDNLLNDLVDIEHEDYDLYDPQDLDINILGLLINPSYKTLFIAMIKDLVISNRQLDAYIEKQDIYEDYVPEKMSEEAIENFAKTDKLFRIEKQHNITELDYTKRLKKALIFRVCNLIYEKLDNVLSKDDYKDLILSILDLKTLSLKEFIKQSNKKRYSNKFVIQDTVKEFKDYNLYFKDKGVKPQIIECLNIILLVYFILNYMKDINLSNINNYYYSRIVHKNNVNPDNLPSANIISNSIYESLERPNKIRTMNFHLLQKIMTNLYVEQFYLKISSEYLYYYTKDVERRNRYLKWNFIDYINFNVLYNNLRIMETLHSIYSIKLPNLLNILTTKRLFRYIKRYPKNVLSNIKHQHYRNLKTLYRRHVWFLNQDVKARNRRYAQTVAELPKYRLQRSGILEPVPNEREYVRFFYARRHSYKRYIKNIVRYCFTHPILFNFYRDLFKLPCISAFPLTEVTHLTNHKNRIISSYIREWNKLPQYEYLVEQFESRYKQLIKYFTENSIGFKSQSTCTDLIVLDNPTGLKQRVFIIGKEYMTDIPKMISAFSKIFRMLDNKGKTITISTLKYFKYPQRYDRTLVSIIMQYNIAKGATNAFNPYIANCVLTSTHALDDRVNALDVQSDIIKLNIYGLNYINYMQQLIPLMIDNIQSIKTLSNELMVITVTEAENYESNPNYLNDMKTYVDFVNNHQDKIVLAKSENNLEYRLNIDRDKNPEIMMHRGLPIKYDNLKIRKINLAAIPFDGEVLDEKGNVTHKQVDVINNHKEPYEFDRHVLKVGEYDSVTRLNDNKLQDAIENARNRISINNIHEYLNITEEDLKRKEKNSKDKMNIHYYGQSVLTNDSITYYKLKDIRIDESFVLYNIQLIQDVLYTCIINNKQNILQKYDETSLRNLLEYMALYKIKTAYIPYLNKLHIALWIQNKDLFNEFIIITDEQKKLEYIIIKLNENSQPIFIKDLYYLTKLDDRQLNLTIHTKAEFIKESKSHYKYLDQLNNRLKSELNCNLNVHRKELINSNIRYNIIFDNELSHKLLWESLDFGKPDRVFHHRLIGCYEYEMKDLYKDILSYRYPVGNPTLFVGDDIKLNDIFGLVYAKVEIPDVFKPQLPYKYLNSVIYPTGKIEGWYFSEELYNLKQLGYKISVIQALHYNSRKLFNNLDNELFLNILSNLIDNPKEYIIKDSKKILLTDAVLDAEMNNIHSLINNPIFRITFNTYKRLRLYKELNRSKNKGQVSAILNDKLYLTAPVPLYTKTSLKLSKIYSEVNIYNENLYELTSKKEPTKKMYNDILIKLYSLIRTEKDKLGQMLYNKRLPIPLSINDYSKDLKGYLGYHMLLNRIEESKRTNEDIFDTEQDYIKALELIANMNIDYEESIDPTINTKILSLYKEFFKDPLYKNSVNIYAIDKLADIEKILNKFNEQREGSILNGKEANLETEYYYDGVLFNYSKNEKDNIDFRYNNENFIAKDKNNIDNKTIVLPTEHAQFKKLKKNNYEVILDLNKKVIDKSEKEIHKGFGDYLREFKINLDNSQMREGSLGYRYETAYDEITKKIIIKSKEVNLYNINNKYTNKFNIKNVRLYSYPIRIINEKFIPLEAADKSESVQNLYSIKNQSGIANLIFDKIREEVSGLNQRLQVMKSNPRTLSGINYKINKLINGDDKTYLLSDEERALIEVDPVAMTKTEMKLSDLYNLIKREDLKDLSDDFYSGYFEYIENIPEVLEERGKKELDEVHKLNYDLTKEQLRALTYRTRSKLKRGCRL